MSRHASPPLTINTRSRIAIAAIIVSLWLPAVTSWVMVGPQAIVFESSAHAADYGRYFEELFHGHSFWLWGQYALTVVGYAPLYGLLYVLEAMTGSSSTAYHVALLFFQLLAVGCFVAFVRKWQSRIAPDRTASTFDRIVPWVLGLLYVTSLANFNYLKSNVMFGLASYALPIQLYLVDRYVSRGSAAAMGAVTASALLMNAANATFFFYIGGLVWAYMMFLRLQSFAVAPPWRILVVDTAALAFALLPAAILILVSTAVNIPYYGSLEELAQVASEGMYSMNANMVNIMSLTTDWAFFDGFNGEPYYEFAEYYRQRGVRLLAFVLILLPLGLALAKMFGGARGFYRFWVAVGVLCVFVQLGANNPVFRWLIENIVLFQIFRNVTKLSPIFYFALLAVICYQVAAVRSEQLRRAAFAIFALGGLAYNLPFWTYADYFHRDRSAGEIPKYWRDAGAWMKRHAPEGSRTLLLPATYVNDTFLWNGKKVLFQGTLPDGIWTTRTFRLSEALVGPPLMQAEMRRVFVPDASNVRGLTTDYAALGTFTARNGFGFIVLNRDLWSEYQHLSDVRAWLERDGFARVAVFGRLEIFHNPARDRQMFESEVKVSWSQIDNLTYRLRVDGVTGPFTLRFNEAYRPGWRLAVQEPSKGSECAHICPPSPLLGHWDDFRLALRPAVAPSHHARDEYGGNAWRIDPADILRTGSASSNLDLVLHFRPQLYFMAACWVFVLCTAAVVVLFFLIPLTKRVNFERPFHRHKTI